MFYAQSRADFNESTYGTHVSSELEKWLLEQDELIGIAVNPTLAEEADLGYDVKIPAKWGMLYLQYKMPHFLRRKNASEYPVFHSPYFRFSVKTDRTSNGKIQHNVLCDLENSGQEVFYAAPCFMTSQELFNHMLADVVCDNSVFPRPSQLGSVIEGSIHRYAYTGDQDIRAFSEPGPEFSAGVEILAMSIRQKVNASEPILLSSFLERTIETLTTSIGNFDAIHIAPLQRIALLSNSVGLQPILVREAQLAEHPVLAERESN